MSADLDTRVLRKITLRIIPFVVLLYFIAFIDRVNIGFAALTMNKDLGFSPTVFGFGAGIFFLGYFLFEVPSNLVLDKVVVLWARDSDRSGERTWHVVGACMLASLGLVLAGFAGTVLAVLLALTLVNIGISSAKPPLWSMPTMFLSGSAAAAGIATINSIGNLGGFVGPAMIGWIKDLTGSFQGGLFFVAALLVLSAILTLVLARSQRTSAASAANALPQQ